MAEKFDTWKSMTAKDLNRNNSRYKYLYGKAAHYNKDYDSLVSDQKKRIQELDIPSDSIKSELIEQ